MMHGSHGSFFYESVHRIEKLLEQLEKLQFMGKISISRELSKKFEQIITSDLSNIQEFIKNNMDVWGGEFSKESLICFFLCNFMIIIKRNF